MIARILHFGVIALFIAGAILMFLGLESEASPAGMRLSNSGFHCITGSLVATVVEWLWRNHGSRNRH